MTASYFVDTNILIYAHDVSAGEKHERARALIEQLWESDEGVISTQVLQEFSVNIRRKAQQPMSLENVHRLVRAYSRWRVISPNVDSILRALEMEQRYKTSFWDALIFAGSGACGGRDPLLGRPGCRAAIWRHSSGQSFRVKKEQG